MTESSRFSDIVAPLAAFLAAGVLLAGCSSGNDDTQPAPTSPATSSTTTAAPAKAPTLKVSVLVKGLQIPWDIAFLPNGGLLYTERDRERITLRGPDGSSTVVLDRPAGMWHQGETGLESVILAADFDTSNDIITCHGFKNSSTQDVRLVRWHLGKDKATFVRNLVTGLPSSTGRHGGCALERGKDGSLYVGTGDAAVGTNAEDLTSGGGKVLRIDDSTGKGLPDNPFADSGNAMKQRIWSYGHRNVQGLALNPADGTVWSVEHGSFRDDEVNHSVKGGDFGWNPVPGFNESVPMTDQSLPGKQIEAAWSSGKSTLATSGGTFLDDDKWGAWKGRLAIASLKDESLHILGFDRNGKFTKETNVKALKGKYGRLRATVEGPDGSLYVTTSNGADDKILRITPGG